MQQYFLGKIEDELIKYKDSSNSKEIIKDISCEDKYFANQKHEGKKAVINDSKFSNCTFAKVGLKEARINGVNFNFCVFIDCYFRKTIFDDCNFTGAKFINCNFDQASITNCIYEYAKFENCIIPYHTMEGNLPKSKHNLCRYLCRDLGIECLKLGMDREYLLYYYQEMRSSEAYNWEKFWHPHQPEHSYFQKYNWSDQLSGLLSFLLSKLNKFLWGYGENIFRLIINIVLTILIFAGITNVFVPTLSFGECLFASVSSFQSSGAQAEALASVPSINILFLVESAFGVVFIGFFVACLFRHINRR